MSAAGRTPEDFLSATLRGEVVAGPSAPAETDALLTAARQHGVVPLVYARQSQSDAAGPFTAALRGEAIEGAMWEMRHQQVLGAALSAVASAGIAPVLIKGTALAYALYPDPALRSRADTDMLIDARDLECAHALLTSTGFQRELGVSGEFITYQASYTRDAGDGTHHTIDLHWQVNNSQVLAGLFSYDELRRDAQALPLLSPHALGTSPVHSMLVACMHRATHRQNPYYVDGQEQHDENRLVWLYDLHLLAESFDAAQWKQFGELAVAKQLAAICHEALLRTRERFDCPVPVAVMELLAARRSELPERYLDAGKLEQQWLDFRALGSVRPQARYVRELFFPPKVYMRQRYPSDAHSPLPWLYLRRTVNGMTKALLAAARRGRSLS